MSGIVVAVAALAMVGVMLGMLSLSKEHVTRDSIALPPGTDVRQTVAEWAARHRFTAEKCPAMLRFKKNPGAVVIELSQDGDHQRLDTFVEVSELGRRCTVALTDKSLSARIARAKARREVNDLLDTLHAPPLSRV